LKTEGHKRELIRQHSSFKKQRNIEIKFKKLKLVRIKILFFWKQGIASKMPFYSFAVGHTLFFLSFASCLSLSLFLFLSFSLSLFLSFSLSLFLSI
jgi:hypothetical protein